jgi:hypothetical protein
MTEVTPDSSAPPLPDLRSLTDREVFATWVAAMTELRRRGIIRSDNTPTGDYAEWLVASRLGLVLEANSQSGYDAIGPDGVRYQIKARRLATTKSSRQLSTIRNLDKDPFDMPIAVIFGPAFEVLECWQIPIKVVREHTTYRAHVNGHTLFAAGPVLADERTVRLSSVEDDNPS